MSYGCYCSKQDLCIVECTIKYCNNNTIKIKKYNAYTQLSVFSL